MSRGKNKKIIIFSLNLAMKRDVLSCSQGPCILQSSDCVLSSYSVQSWCTCGRV